MNHKNTKLSKRFVLCYNLHVIKISLTTSPISEFYGSYFRPTYFYAFYLITLGQPYCLFNRGEKDKIKDKKRCL